MRCAKGSPTTEESISPVDSLTILRAHCDKIDSGDDEACSLVLCNSMQIGKLILFLFQTINDKQVDSSNSVDSPMAVCSLASTMTKMCAKMDNMCAGTLFAHEYPAFAQLRYRAIKL